MRELRFHVTGQHNGETYLIGDFNDYPSALGCACVDYVTGHCEDWSIEDCKTKQIETHSQLIIDEINQGA